MNHKFSRVSAVVNICYIAANVVLAWFWIIAALYAFLLGGTPGPGYGRSVPMLYVNIMSLGIPGAALGIAAGSIGHILGKKVKALPVSSAILIAAAAIPLFLMDMTVPGLIVLSAGVPPALIYLFAFKH